MDRARTRANLPMYLQFLLPVIVTPSFVFNYGPLFCLGDNNNNVKHISMQARY